MNPKALYAAVVRRDPAYEGLFFFAVKTTGIFCRPTCASRRPLAQNVEFFRSPAEAQASGYRACRKCDPLRARQEPLLRLLGGTDGKADVREAGVSESTARRRFVKRFGLTFRQYERAMRLARSSHELRAGAKVIDAQQDGGFQSGSGFRKAFKTHFGVAPSQAPASFFEASFETPLGRIVGIASDAGLHVLQFADQRSLKAQRARFEGLRLGGHRTLDGAEAWLKAYFSGQQLPSVPLAAGGTPFQKRVWRALLDIQSGATLSYSGLAQAIGMPGAARAVATANARNPLCLIVPCHRVIGGDGALRGYSGGVMRKRWLLEHEQKSYPVRTARR